MPEVVVFAGPCLPREPDAEWRALLARVDLRPPAQRGDVLQAMTARPSTIVILDGYYFSVPAVTHKELLYALTAGIRVIGAASMGALRAVELGPQGMIGVGRVFEWFRDGLLDGDDEVAILHAPEEYGYAAATVALVEVRAALERMTATGQCAADDAERVIQAIKTLPFSARLHERVFAITREVLGDTGALALEAAMSGNGVKTRDGRAAIELALGTTHEISDPVAVAPTTNFLSHYREWYLRPPPLADGDPRRRTFLKAWYMVQLLHPFATSFVTMLRLRFLCATAARDAGIAIEPGHVRDTMHALRTHLSRSPSASALPDVELTAEAEEHLLASLAVARWGSTEGACAALTATLGIDTETPQQTLLHLASLQDDSIPPWVFVRASLFSPTLAAALEVAEAAGEIFAAFRVWSQGARVTVQDLERTACVLWHCGADELRGEAAARGLLRSHTNHGFVPGYHGAVELITAAERLGRDADAYALARDRLRATTLLHVLEWSGGQGRHGDVEQPAETAFAGPPVASQRFAQQVSA